MSIMTVGELRKELEGVPDDTPLYVQANVKGEEEEEEDGEGTGWANDEAFARSATSDDVVDTWLNTKAQAELAKSLRSPEYGYTIATGHLFSAFLRSKTGGDEMVLDVAITDSEGDILS